MQNIYYTTRDVYGRQFDYRKFWQKISEQGEVVCANAYAIQRNDDGQIKFQDALRHIGFDVKLKPFTQRSDGSAKGDWDVGITIDVMESAPQVDVVVLLSGDGDFEILMHKIKMDYGVTTCVYGVPELTARALVEVVDQFCPIEADSLLNYSRE